MRRIHIPEKNIQLVDPLTKQAGEFVTWTRWFMACVMNDRRMGTTPGELARVVRLVDRLDGAGPGRYVDFEEEDWSRARGIVEHPELAIGGPLIMMQLTPYAEAFLKAQYLTDRQEKAKAEANGSAKAEENAKA